MGRNVRKLRFTRIAAAAVIAASAAGVGAVAVPSPAAAADTCYTGAFCWYWLQNQGGRRGSQTQYTTGWVRMNTLVDDSESSYDAQYPDGCAFSNPYVYLSDTYLSQRWTTLVGSYSGDRRDNFGEFNNRYNDIWNSCH
jgi:hypothetical protein